MGSPFFVLDFVDERYLSLTLSAGEGTVLRSL
jgi:hypothetical protein